ncbi:hypothetical protein BSKO_02949 [Bryopsis sp. KO-2023]|nr:hypothetical protein BSKO_02949 [Bryopsis sp. KO-2023]
MRRKYSEPLHGDIDVSVKFGRLYLIGAPPAFTEDPEGVTVRQIVEALENGQRSKMHPGLFSEEPPSTSRRKAPPKKEHFMTDSFFPGVRMDCGKDIERRVVELGFGEPETETLYKVVVALANGRVKAVYSSDLKLVGVRFAYLRWMHCNYKRLWVRDRMSTAEGCECDFRVEIRTRRGEALGGKLAQQLEGLLYWGPDCCRSRGLPMPRVRRDMMSQILMMRECVEKTYRSTKAKDSTPAFLLNMKIRVAQCRAHSRPTGSGDFNATEDFVDVRIKPQFTEIPGRDTWNQLSHVIWDLSFKISDEVRFKSY